MDTYRIPIRLTMSDWARNKAAVACEKAPDGTFVGAEGCQWFTVRAQSVAHAKRQICKAVRPADSRPIMSVHMVKYFRVGGQSVG